MDQQEFNGGAMPWYLPFPIQWGMYELKPIINDACSIYLDLLGISGVIILSSGQGHSLAVPLPPIMAAFLLYF